MNAASIARSIAKAKSVERSLLIKIVIMRFIELATSLKIRTNAPADYMDDLLDRGIVNDKLVSGIQYFFSADSKVFMEVNLRIDWEKQKMLLGSNPEDIVSIDLDDDDQSLEEAISKKLNDLVAYVRKCLRQDGADKCHWLVAWRESGGSEVNKRAHALADSLGFKLLADTDAKAIKSFRADIEISTSPDKIETLQVIVRKAKAGSKQN